MKMISFNTNKILNVVALSVLVLFAVLSYSAKPSFFTIQNVESKTADNVAGYAWASGSGTFNDGVGIGWISFNNTSDGTPDNPAGYGVNVNDAARLTGGPGPFSGHAWSENVGWISFNGSETGPPPAAPSFGGSIIAQVEWGGTNAGKVTGWARALSACASVPCPTSGPITPGGWDGWIKLSEGTLASNPSHQWHVGGVPIAQGVKINNGGQFSGYAYGSDVLGWIDFAPKDPTTGQPIGPIIVDPAQAACTPTTPGVVWSSSCVAFPNFCSTNPVGTVIQGTQTGQCTSGASTQRTCNVDADSNGVPDQCLAAAPPPPSTASCNFNRVCQPPTETFQSCPSDCKAQFHPF